MDLPLRMQAGCHAVQARRRATEIDIRRCRPSLAGASD